MFLSLFSASIKTLLKFLTIIDYTSKVTFNKLYKVTSTLFNNVKIDTISQ